jgi:hypothetical protein
MKTFKSFLLDTIDEVAKPKAEGEKKFADAHKVEVTDPTDQANNSAKVVTKALSAKHKGDPAPVKEADMSKGETKMAHTIGKHFEKKGVGDKSKGGPYAVATAMVQDKPEAAKKAYATIKAKAKNEEHEILLTSLYDDLSESNKEFLLKKLDEDYDKLIEFALSVVEE